MTRADAREASGRRAPARLLAFGLLLACTSGLACGEGGEAPTSAGAPGTAAPERIVLVVADTLRADHTSPYGAKLATPQLQALAERGQVFTNALSSFHQTTMSMSSLMTGRTPSLESGARAEPLPWTSRSWCGLARLAEDEADSCIPQHVTTLGEDMRAAGYRTWAVVSNRLIFRPYGYDQGFMQWIEVGERERPDKHPDRKQESQLRTGKRVNAVVRKLLANRPDDRFFLYVHYIDAHDYGIRPDLKKYADGVRYVDRALGGLLGQLEEHGLLEGTTVIFTSDHGENFDEPHALPTTRKHFGNPSFEPLLRVPLIVAPPSHWPSERLVRTQDLRSLLREIAGLGPLEPVDIEPDEIFLTEQFYQTYRKGRFKSMWKRDLEEVVLFDLEADPGETVDVAGAHPEVVTRHRARMEALLASLATRTGEDSELSEDDAERLRALGYLE